MLENANIRLRALEPEDIDCLYKWENDASLWLIGDTNMPLSRYMLKQYIAASHLNIYERERILLVIEYRPTAQAIGTVDLYDFNPHHGRVCTGIFVEQAFRRRGIASEAMELVSEYAFAFLRVHQIYAYVPANNEASRALFLGTGFTANARLTDWLSTPDGYADVIIMQRLNK